MSSESVKSFLERYGNQVLITSGGVALTAGFAQHAEILPWYVAWGMAIGFEWSWIRGLMQAGTTRSRWVTRMVWAGMSSVITFGVLFCLIRYGVIPERPGWEWGIVLSLAHVIPIAAMALCTAMIHREAELEAATERREREREDRERDQRLADEQAADARALRQKEADLDLWHKAQLVKASLRKGATSARPADPASYPAPRRVYECPRCGSEITQQQYGAAMKHAERWKGCPACRQP